MNVRQEEAPSAAILLGALRGIWDHIINKKIVTSMLVIICKRFCKTYTIMITNIVALIFLLKCVIIIGETVAF